MKQHGFRGVDVVLVGLAAALVMGFGRLDAGPVGQHAADARIDQQAPPPPPPPPPPGPGRPGLDAHLFGRLGLTPAERDQIDALLEQARAEAEPYHAELAATRDAMREAVQADVFDEAAVRTLAVSQADATIEIAVIDARAQSAIYRVLTVEQRARMAKLTSQAPPPRR